MVRARTNGHNSNGNGANKSKTPTSKPKHNVGRPAVYNPEYHPTVAYKMISRYGLSYQMLADAFCVTEALIVEWKEKHQEFLIAMKNGEDDFIAGTVKKALSARARGYSHSEEKIFCNTVTGDVTRVTTTKHYPPDVVAIIYLLNNWSRRRGNNEWMHVNRFEHTGKDGKPIQTQDAITQELLRKLLDKAEPEILTGLRTTLEHIACANTDPC